MAAQQAKRFMQRGNKKVHPLDGFFSGMVDTNVITVIFLHQPRFIRAFRITDGRSRDSEVISVELPGEPSGSRRHLQGKIAARLGQGLRARWPDGKSDPSQAGLLLGLAVHAWQHRNGRKCSARCTCADHF